jgi:hypothetical protein
MLSGKSFGESVDPTEIQELVAHGQLIHILASERSSVDATAEERRDQGEVRR